MDVERNVLVISDMHLGEDLRPGRPDRAHLDRVEAELVAFLKHYTAHREGDLPWRLVVNGDMIDFLAICVMPVEGELEVEPEELVYGLSTREAAALHKLAQVQVRNADFFGALAEFVAADNALEFIVGNHDLELHWPAVQVRMVEIFEELHAGVGERIRFHPWFYYEPGRLWIEHGHQYDVYCSYDTVLDPRDQNAPYQFEENLGSAAMRYVGNRLPGNTAEHQDSGFVAYLKLAFIERPDMTVGLLKGYGALVRRLLGQWLRMVRQPGPFLTRRKEHKRKLTEMAAANGLPPEVLQKVYSLRAKPIWSDLYKLTTGLMLGRLLVTLLAVACVPLVVGLLPWSISPWILVLLVGTAVAMHVVLAKSRDLVDPGEMMERSALKIRELVDAPLLVMGHTHRPVAKPLSKGGWYFNTGTWVSDPKSLLSFTHLRVVQRRGRTRASLCRWARTESRELRTEETTRPRAFRVRKAS